MRAILTYHSVDTSGSVTSVHPATFARHVEWLAAEHVPVVSVPELLSWRGEGPALALTFDDAFANFASAAWPLLRARGLPVTLFVPTGFVGGVSGWDATGGRTTSSRRLLGWPALARLAEEGVTLGAHSRTHPDLRRLDAEALRDELAGSVDDVARETGHRPDGFAYPYGYLDDRVADAAGSVCRWAVTTALRPLAPDDDAFRLPRLDAYYLRGPGRLEWFASAPFRLWMRARHLVRAARGRP